MSIKILDSYLRICKALDLKPTFDGLKKVSGILK